jgi:N-acetylglucosaminyldiphosphoundecaprenol N-acetyl-beta-D-mannosaminyltransferase
MVDESQKFPLLGIYLDPIGMDAAVERCISWCTAELAAHTVVPVNAAVVVATRSDKALHEACRNADLSLADGAAVVWAARLAGGKIPERVTGIDLMERLLERAEREGLGVFFLGATPAVLERLIEVCQDRHPRLQIAGYQHGFFPRAEEDRIAVQIRASGARIVFVGMPSPYKEVWAERFRNAVGVPTLLSVGGSFDVVAGIIPRSPRWLQMIGMEWFWRVLCEPKRLWKRYLLANSYFVALTLGLVLRRIALSTAARLRNHIVG